MKNWSDFCGRETYFLAQDVPYLYDQIIPKFTAVELCDISSDRKELVFTVIGGDFEGIELYYYSYESSPNELLSADEYEITLLSDDEKTKKIIKKAREKYVSDNVEIDDLPKLSVGEGGTWVAAWVWVPKEGLL